MAVYSSVESTANMAKRAAIVEKWFVTDVERVERMEKALIITKEGEYG